MSVKKAALTFHVPRATLARKIKGTVPEGRTMGPATILTKQEEDLLEKWLLGLCRKGFPVVKRMLLDSVKKTLDLAQRPSRLLTITYQEKLGLRRFLKGIQPCP